MAMSAATCAPPVTGSEPPSQKSFCTSTTISALFMAPNLCRPDGQPVDHVLDLGVPQLPLVNALPEVDGDVQVLGRGRIDQPAVLGEEELLLGAAADVEPGQRAR